MPHSRSLLLLCATLALHITTSAAQTSQPCPAGRHGSSGSCTACPAGQYSDSPNAAQCKQCPVARYQPATGQTACNPTSVLTCPPGFSFASSSALNATALTGSRADDAKCAPCAPGFFKSATAPASCDPMTTGATDCQPGLALSSDSAQFGGTGSTANDGRCALCGPGKLVADAPGLSGRTVCAACPEGLKQEAAQHSASTCQSCPAGFAANDATTQCFACPAGKVSRDESYGCFYCGVGAFFNESSRSCSECEAGRFQPQESAPASSCSLCPAGFVSVPCGKRDKCRICSAGFFSPDSGLEHCTACATSTAPGTTGCPGCGPGKYAAGSLAICVECPVGYANEAFGAKQCSQCAPGFYATAPGSPFCRPCPGGRYGTTVRAATLSDCTGCAAGKYGSLEHQTREADACSACPAGFASTAAASSACEPCRAGFYAEVPKQTSCQNCAPGKYSVFGEGQIRPSDCRACAPGKYSAAGAAQTSPFVCMDCPVGYFSDAGPGQASSHACKACALGTYYAAGLETGQTRPSACEPCPPDHYGHSNTTGVSLADRCAACPAGRSTATTPGARDLESCLCSQGTNYKNAPGSCEPCPVGADCGAAADMDIGDLVARGGHWRATNWSVVFLNCELGLRGIDAAEQARERCCPAGRCVSPLLVAGNGSRRLGESTLWNPDDQCRDGYRGPLCLVCAEGYVPSGGSCRQCEGGASIGNAVISVVCFSILTMLVSMYIFLYWSCAKNAHTKTARASNKIRRSSTSTTSRALERVRNSKSVLGLIKIGTTYLQLLASLPSVYVNAPWPNVFLRIVAPFGMMNVDITGLFSMTICSLNIPFLESFVIKMAVPPLLAGAVVAAYFLSLRILRSRGQLSEEVTFQVTSRLYKTMTLMVLLLYPGLATACFKVFRCTGYPGPGVADRFFILDADPSVACYGEEHSRYVSIAAIFTVLYCAGIPAGIWLVLRRRRPYLYDEKHPKYRKTAAYWGGLYLQYDEDYWFFQSFDMLMKMLFTGVMCLVTPNSPVQVLSGCFLLVFWLLTVLRTAPYKKDTEDLASFLSLLGLTVTMMIAFAMITDDPEDPTFSRPFIEATLIVVSLLSISVQLAIIAYEICSDCSCCKHRKGSTRAEEKATPAKKRPQVQPAQPAAPKTPEQQQLHQQISSWGVDDGENTKKEKFQTHK